MEPQYTSTLLQFSALHEHVHPTSWLAILFFLMHVSGWSVVSETCSPDRVLLAFLNPFWHTLEYYLRLAHDLFLSHPSEFIIRSSRF